MNNWIRLITKDVSDDCKLFIVLYLIWMENSGHWNVVLESKRRSWRPKYCLGSPSCTWICVYQIANGSRLFLFLHLSTFSSIFCWSLFSLYLPGLFLLNCLHSLVHCLLLLLPVDLQFRSLLYQCDLESTEELSVQVCWR